MNALAYLLVQFLGTRVVKGASGSKPSALRNLGLQRQDDIAMIGPGVGQQQRSFPRRLSLADFLAADINGDGIISQEEFLRWKQCAEGDCGESFQNLTNATNETASEQAKPVPFNVTNSTNETLTDLACVDIFHPTIHWKTISGRRLGEIFVSNISSETSVWNASNSSNVSVDLDLWNMSNLSNASCVYVLIPATAPPTTTVTTTTATSTTSTTITTTPAVTTPTATTIRTAKTTIDDDNISNTTSDTTTSTSTATSTTTDPTESYLWSSVVLTLDEELSDEDLLTDSALSVSLKTGLAAGLRASGPTLADVSADQIVIEKLNVLDISDSDFTSITSTTRTISAPTLRRLQPTPSPGAFSLQVSYKLRISMGIAAAAKSELAANKEAFNKAMQVAYADAEQARTGTRPAVSVSASDLVSSQTTSTSNSAPFSSTTLATSSSPQLAVASSSNNEPEEDTDNRGGVIAGIVIVLVFVAIIAVLAAFFMHPKKRENQNATQAPARAEVAEMAPAQLEVAEMAGQQPRAKDQTGPQANSSFFSSVSERHSDVDPRNYFVTVPASETLQIGPMSGTDAPSTPTADYAPSLDAPTPGVRLDDVSMREAASPKMGNGEQCSTYGSEEDSIGSPTPGAGRQSTNPSFDRLHEGLMHRMSISDKEADGAAGIPTIEATPSTSFSGSPANQSRNIHDRAEAHTKKTTQSLRQESELPSQDTNASDDGMSVKEVRQSRPCCTCMSHEAAPGRG